MLLRVNKLNADVIDSVLAIFVQKQRHVVSLETALSDPACAIPDEFVTTVRP